MGLMRVRFEVGGIFRVCRLAARVIRGIGIPCLNLPLVCAAFDGVPGVPIVEGRGGTPGVPMLAENRGLKARGVSGNV